MESVKDTLKKILVIFAFFVGLVLITAGPERAAATALGGWNFVKEVANSIVIFAGKVGEGM